MNANMIRTLDTFAAVVGLVDGLHVANRMELRELVLVSGKVLEGVLRDEMAADDRRRQALELLELCVGKTVENIDLHDCDEWMNIHLADLRTLVEGRRTLDELNPPAALAEAA